MFLLLNHASARKSAFSLFPNSKLSNSLQLKCDNWLSAQITVNFRTYRSRKLTNCRRELLLLLSTYAHLYTSNVTRFTEVRSASARLFAGTWHGAPGKCYYNTLLCCDYFSSFSVVSRAFSALCVYSKFGHHLIP